MDVFGGNYRPDEVIQAMGMSPARPGLFTEMGTDTAAWTTVRNNAGVTGLFLWTGAAYLGEADGLWPSAESDFGLMDAVGTVRPIGYSWQTHVGRAARRSPPPTGTTADRVLLAPDHPTVSTDTDDVSYVQGDRRRLGRPRRDRLLGRRSRSASAGRACIVAVDSGSPVQESFRGTVRKAYQGVAYAPGAGDRGGHHHGHRERRRADAGHDHADRHDGAVRALLGQLQLNRRSLRMYGMQHPHHRGGCRAGPGRQRSSRGGSCGRQDLLRRAVG